MIIQNYLCFSAVGKTCLLVSYTTESYMSQYVPTIFDNYAKNIMYAGRPINLSRLSDHCLFSTWFSPATYFVDLYDTAGQDEYLRLRPLVYPQTDVFLVCFSLIDPDMATETINKWFGEVRHFCPGAPIILVGTKLDLRNDKQVQDRLLESGQSPITYNEGMNYKVRAKAVEYVECSAKTSEGVKEVFDLAVRAALAQEVTATKPKKKKRCNLMWNQIINIKNVKIVYVWKYF